MKGLGIVNQPKTEFTVEDIQQRLPAKKNTITQEVVDLINDASSDPMFNGDEFVRSMVDYQSAMIQNSASVKEYVNALKFCAYLEAEGDNLTEAYKKARANDEFVMTRLEAQPGTQDYAALNAAASRYRKNPLVKQILTQSDMPLYLMFQASRYKAVATLAEEMANAPYSKDRINAADKLLTHVKPPENIQIELDVGVKENNAIQDLNAQLAEIAAKQKVHLQSGTADLGNFGAMKPKDEDVIDGEVE